MKVKRKNVKKLFTYFSVIFSLSLASFFIFTLIDGRVSKAELNEGWDGASISQEFKSGNGTLENPYIISSPEDFIYFKNLIEGDNYKTYQDKYYKLDQDINLGEKEITSIGKYTDTDDRLFNGHLNGNGHKIYNFKIVEPNTINDTNYYSLFTGFDSGSLENISFDNFLIEVSSENSYTSLFGSLKNTDDIQSTEGNSEENTIENSVENTEDVQEDVSIVDEVNEEEKLIIKNVSFNNFVINTGESEHTVSLIKNSISSNTLITNISFIGNIMGNKSSIYLSTNNNGNLNNVLYRVITDGELKIDNTGINNLYNIVDDKIYLNNEVISTEDLLNTFNEELDGKLYYDYVDGVLKLLEYVEPTKSIDDQEYSFDFSIRGSADITLHASGVDSSAKTVYVNDLTSDYNYYRGLNYTTSSNGSIPTGVNRNLYNDTTLAKIYIAYKGSSINSSSTDVGYVSLDEQYSDIIYYKYYPIVSGYVTIPLIDNPYADRPNNRAFNGWVTDYPGAVVSLDTDTYTRYVKIPAPSTPSNATSITMYASWTEATAVAASVSSGSLSSSGLKSVGMYAVASRVPVYAPNPQLYTYNSMRSGTSSGGTPYPNGAVNANGQSLNGQNCVRYDRWTQRTCYYYMPVDNNDVVQGATNYYYLNNNSNMASYSFTITGYTVSSPFLNIGDMLVGFFKKGVPAGSLNGYYSNTGVLQTSGSCNGNSCNNYYELMQYDTSNVLSDSNYDYYYLVTRDTNIAYLTGNINGFSTSVPVTVTGLNNGTDRSGNSITLSNTGYSSTVRSIRAGADLRIEYCELYTGSIGDLGTSAPANSDYNYIYGNFYNLKIGRGISIEEGTYNIGSSWRPEYVDGFYLSARGVVGGNNSSTGSSSSPTKYSFIVESGYYNYISTVGTSGTSPDYYVNAFGTYGSDIDRVKNDNESLRVGYNLASTFGGDNASSSSTELFATNTVKSGTYGEMPDDTASGIYAGGLNGGSINSPAKLIVEGGKILYINGGPLVSSSLTSYNAIYINVKGGEVSAIYGGAARSETYGNRIVDVSGGTVNYSVFGGSNGIEGNNSNQNKGTLNGSTFIRIGGNSTIGTATDTIFGAEAGSVFGAGNGREGYTEIGSVNNSYVLVQDQCTIKKNVYGGGNYGSVKAQSGRTSTSTITIDGGNVKGSVYGGGNNNGSGSTTITSTININVNNGTVDGSVYGGSCAQGIVYGNTNVTINGGTVKTDVYGGGEGGYSDSSPGTYVRDDVNVTVNNGTVSGNVYGGSAYGTVNAIDENTTSSNASTTVTVNGGTITNSVFGGAKGSSSYTPKVVGDITVNINGGSSGKVFGGFDASGKPTASDEVYLNSGTVGDAFGGGNNANQDVTNIYLQGSTITGNLYGGSNLLGTVSESHVTVTSGSVTDIYGGNNLAGTTVVTNVSVVGGNSTINGDIYGGGNEAPSTTTNVNITNANVNDVYGGCKKANATTTNVNVTNTTGDNVFGGSNVSGTVTTTNVKVNGSTLASTYGGNNAGGSATTTNVQIGTSQITNVFGGGDNASSGTSNVLINSGTITNLYGGGNEAGLTTSNVAIANGTITNAYGGSNTTGDVTDSFVNVGLENIGVKVNYSKSAPESNMNSDKPTYSEITVTVTNYTNQLINDWEVSLNIPQATLYDNGSNSNVTINANSNTVNVNSRRKNNNNAYNALEPYGSYTFTFSVLSDCELENFHVTGDEVRPTASGTPSINITNLYGGNNAGGVTSNTHIKADKGTITTIYGGGNVANVSTTNVVVNEGVTSTNIYGGGNAAGVNGDTLLDINGATVNSNIYGGGNEGIVRGSSNVFITDGTIKGNAFAGGNGASAVVHRNSTITIDGSTEIGTASSVAPNAGCVFGSGNAASTGFQVTNDSVGTVNIVGGIIHGNVYGGPKMAVVYGTTDTNIGTDSVNNANLIEDDIIISGTVFGGGESNSSGEQAYDYTFISVTQGIDVNINGNNYITNNHEFIINGSIFGSGNASSSSGDSNIYIKDLGTKAKPNKSISIQRATNLVIDHSVIELSGTTDRTNEYSDIKYSLNLINKLTSKNSTTLLLHHTSNMLLEYYSGYDDPQQGLVPATVDIDEENKSVTKNTDNRIYMIPGENLHVATNQNATEYGKVTGMTFFGMYIANDNGTYRFGLYDDGLDYGDE